MYSRPAIVTLILLLQLVLCSASQQCTSNDTASFETVLQRARVLDCGTDKTDQDCSLLHYVSLVADKAKQDLEFVIKRTSVAVITSGKIANEFKAAWNASLEARVTKHFAFVAAISCLDDNVELCMKLQNSCPGSVQHSIFLVSAHCSESVTCTPIGTHLDLNGKPTVSPDLPSYVAFRLLERQVFIARDLGEIQLGVSAENEYTIQKDLHDAHGIQLAGSGKPVAMFVAWPVKTQAYYHIFSLFLDAALGLRDVFAIHVVTASLSRIAHQSKRPFYRHDFEGHKAYLGLYTKAICFFKPDWPFSCKPRVATADSLLTAGQISGFLLHQTLQQQGIKSDAMGAALPFPSFAKANDLLVALVSNADSFILAVASTEDTLTDPLQDWERVKDSSSYLGSMLGLTFYPVAVTKPVALDLLGRVNSGIKLAYDCEKVCLVVRLPGAGYEVLGSYDPLMNLETAVQDAIRRSEGYHAVARMSLDNINSFSQADLPHRLTGCGHFVGTCDVGSDYLSQERTDKQLPAEPLGNGRIDAFIEQSKFNDIYNTSNVLVVEQNEELLRDFLDRAGQDKPWLVLFTVSWSPLCKAARAVWSSVSKCVKSVGLHDVQLVKVDCFEANKLCKHLGIDTYPTIAMFKQGGIASTYAGPIAHGRLCAYANLALTSNFLRSQSAQETRDLLAKFLPLTSRAFILSGSKVPNSLAALAAEMSPGEALIFQQTPETEGKGSEFVAHYQDSYPASKQFEGNMDCTASLRKFITDGHLDHVFPCSWVYLAQALNSTRPLIVLFHTASMAEHMALLKQLKSRLSRRDVSVCHLQLKRLSHLDDLVQQIAGHNLPALVVLAGDRTVSYQLPLAPIPAESLVSEATDWVERAFSSQLSDGRSIASTQEQWVPSGQVHNFVDQIYRGPPGHSEPSKEAPSSPTCNRRIHGRPFGGQLIARQAADAALVDAKPATPEPARDEL